jgi:hypothetical protein
VRTSAPAIIVTAAVLAALTACAPFADDSCTPLVPVGTQASYVEADGAVLSAPDVTFPTPLLSKGAQQSVLVAGDGEPIGAGQPVDLQASLFDGESGEFITASSYDRESPPLRRTAGSDADVLAQILQCARVGSRIAATVTVADVFGAGQLDPQLGLLDDDPLVLVLDVQAAYLARAQGVPQLGASGVPAVVTTPDGVPGITIPDAPAPTELIDHVLVRGSGETIKRGDRAVLHYTGVVWETGAVFDSSWERQLPSTFVVESFTVDPSGIVPGLADALTGKTVGSQVVVVIPPSLGYPEGRSPAAIPPGTTMIFVVDLLGVER